MTKLTSAPRPVTDASEINVVRTGSNEVALIVRAGDAGRIYLSTRQAERLCEYLVTLFPEHFLAQPA